MTGDGRHSCSRGATNFPVTIWIIAIFIDILASGSFQVQLLAESLDDDHHFESSSGGYNVRFTKFFHRLIVQLFARCELRGMISLDFNMVTDMEHMVVGLEYRAPWSTKDVPMQVCEYSLS